MYFSADLGNGKYRFDPVDLEGLRREFWHVRANNKDFRVKEGNLKRKNQKNKKMEKRVRNLIE